MVIARRKKATVKIQESQDDKHSAFWLHRDEAGVTVTPVSARVQLDFESGALIWILEEKLRKYLNTAGL